jgi:hypothetical protein
VTSETGDADADETERPWAIGERAVEQYARELSDLPRIVDPHA